MVRITSVQAFELAIPWLQPTEPSPWIPSVGQQLLVRIQTDAPGIEGWGESFALGGAHAVQSVIENALAPSLIGATLDDPAALADRLSRATMIFARHGIGLYAISGVEIALWDALGRVHGVPVHTLLGHSSREEFPAYASLLRHSGVDAVLRAADHWFGQGFRAVKLHEADPIVASVVARQAPPQTISLDVNAAWTLEEALRNIEMLDELRLLWLEEPVWPPDDREALGRLSSVASTPIAAGENEPGLPGIAELIASRAIDVVQPSVIKMGGIDAMRKACEQAVVAGLAVAPHSFYFGPGLAATLHVAAVCSNLEWIEYPAGDLEAPLVDPPIRPDDGLLRVPSGPGLGVAPNLQLLGKYLQRASTPPFSTL